MSELDALPKHVCHSCWVTIDNFHKFYRKVHVAQSKYLNELLKHERENNFIDVLQPVDLNLDVPIIQPIDEIIPMSPTENDGSIKIEYDTGESVIPTIFSYDETDRIKDTDSPEHRRANLDKNINSLDQSEEDSGKKF